MFWNETLLSWLLWNISLIILLRLAASWQLIYFFHSQNQSAKTGSMAFRSRSFHAMYLAAESSVFAWDAAEPHGLKLLKSSLTKEQPKNNHVKELNRHFLEWKSFIALFSFPALKAPVVRDRSHQSGGCYKIPHMFCFEFLFSLIKKLLKGLKFYFLVLMLMIMMTSLFWFLSLSFLSYRLLPN